MSQTEVVTKQPGGVVGAEPRVANGEASEVFKMPRQEYLENLTKILLPELRANDRVHGIKAINRLGFRETRKEPVISEQLIRHAAANPSKGVLMLDDGRSLWDYTKKGNIHLRIDASIVENNQELLHHSHQKLRWVFVPLHCPNGCDTTALPEPSARQVLFEQFPDCVVRSVDARLLAKAMKIHGHETQARPLEEMYTVTNAPGVLIGGYDNSGFEITTGNALKQGAQVGFMPHLERV